MAAVQMLNNKSAAGGLSAVPSPPSLVERLAEAERAAEAPARRAAELHQALTAALDRSDYANAETLKNDLADARREHAIADAAVTGLRSAIAEIDRQETEDNQAFQAQQRADTARRMLAEARRMEEEYLAELDSELTILFAALAGAKRAFLHCLELEQSTGYARAEQLQARAILGEIPPGQRAVTPNRASVLQDTHAVIREVLKWAP